MSKLKSKQAVKPPCLILSSKQLANRLYSYISMLACYILPAEKWQKRCPLTYMHQYKCPSKEYLNPITFCEVNNTIKPLTHYFSFKNMTAICWSPPPSVCWQVEVRVFLVFCHFWFVESAGNTVVSIMWLAEGGIDHFVIYLGAGPFKYTFTSQRRTYWNFLMSARAFGDTRFKMITLSHTLDWMCCIHACICRKSRDQNFFLLVVHFGRIDTGSIHCICIGCILSTLSFAEQCILFKTSVINENVSHT